MNIFANFFILFLYFVIVNGKSNFSTFFRTFGGNHSKLKEECQETVNSCTMVNKSLSNGHCLDMDLSHVYTYESSKYNLNVDNWIALRAIPYCWHYLQILLCSLKYPECIKLANSWLVNKTTQAICLMTKKECPLLIYKTKDDNTTKEDSNLPFSMYSLVEQTPFFLDCKRYTPRCHSWPSKGSSTPKRSMNCTWPMVKTDQKHLWVKGFSGCAFNCKTPFFSEDEYQYTHIFFVTLGVIFFLLNSFVLLTLTIHKRRHDQYYWHPLLLNLFIFHVYMLISCFGWMLPLLPNIGHSVICRNDGALQIRKPQLKIGESIWCLVSFSVVYFPLLASSITSISFFYSVLSVVKHYANCRLSEDNHTSNHAINFASSKLPFLTKRLGFSIRKNTAERNNTRQGIGLEERKPMIKENENSPMKGNGLNWEYPISKNQTLNGQLYVILISVALLVISLAIAEIRADPITGICFLSSEFMITRICLSVLPLTIFLIVKSIIIYLIIKHLGTIQHHLVIYSNCQQEMHSKRIIHTTRFYVFVVLFLWIFWSFSIYTHWYIFSNETSWYKSLKYNFLCQIKQVLLSSLSIFNRDSNSYICILENKPIINLFILHNCSYFSLNVVHIISSVFNRCTFSLWKQKLLQIIRCYKGYNTSPTDADINSLYLGLQNKTLLDAIWNPGVFIYLVKKRIKKTDNKRNGIEDKTTTVASVEDSSTSYCIYGQDGSLRSCVSMPPIKPTSRRNVCRVSHGASKDSQICTTLDDFLNASQSFVPNNSVRRSYSFGGGPCPMSNSCFDNINNPYSRLQSVSGNQFNSTNHRLIQCNNSLHMYNSNSHTFKKNQYSFDKNGSSSTQIGSRHNTSSFSDKKRNKYSRRLSLSFDRRNGTGISLRSTLNRRKQAARYSVSPKSLSKAINNTSSNLSHHDPASCHSSSFSAESYNSYNLMAQQMGGRWRDICRTRMTLHDAMIWAKTASHSSYHSQLCAHNNICNHQQCCLPTQISVPNYQCSPNNNNVLSNPSNKTFSDYDTSQYFEPQEGILPSILCKEVTLTESMNRSKNWETSIHANDSSDKFNSEDDIVSTNNSLKSTDKESGEFCSDDEVVSLINSDI